MTHVETGITGAKRQSFDRSNPRDLLLRIIQENPGAGEPKLLKLLTEAVRDDQDYLDPIIGYWFANNYRSLVPVRRSPKQRAAQAATQTKAVAAIKQRIVSISLAFIMPNGKTLRDSTGKECTQAGGWFAEIAKCVKSNEKVGSALSEAQLQKLCGGK